MSEPRISVNKLAEYMEANSIRRKKIVYDAKYPKNFIVTRYKESKDTIKQYLEQKHNEDFVIDVITTLEAKEPDTDFQKQDCTLSIEALELFLDSDVSSIIEYDFLPILGNELIKISDISISVNPDLLVIKEINGVKNIGAIKFHFSKNNTLTEESQKIVGAVLYNYVTTHLLNKGELSNPKLCISFDIFNQSLDICPSAYKMRMTRIEAACEEISLWWEKL